MNYNKGFGMVAVLVVVLGIMALGGAGYVAMNPEVLDTFRGEGAEGNGKISIEWNLTSAGEVDGMPYTNVAVYINGGINQVGKFLGSCSEIGATGGVDGKGLLAGELSAVQCWFAGGGNEIGVFAHEDGGVDIMVGELGEGEEGAGVFRGDFSVKNSIVF